MNKKWILPIALLLGLIIRLSIVLFTRPEHLIQLTADDFYIYLQIIRNWVENGILSFDGEVWTNGFHPLFALVMYPLFKIFGGFFSYEKISLVTLSFIDIFTAIFIYKITKFYYSEKTSLFTACFWLFNPGVIFLILLGTESALVGLLLSAFVYTYIKLRKSETNTYSHIALVSLIYGLLFLARTEFALLGPIFYLDMFLHLKKKSNFKQVLLKFLMSALIILALISPWFIYSYLYTGGIAQDSSKALFSLTHMEFSANPSIGLFLLKVFVFATKYLLKVANNLGSFALLGVSVGLILHNFLDVKFKLGKNMKKVLFSILSLSLIVSFLVPEPNLGLSKDLYSILILTNMFLLSTIATYILAQNYSGKNLQNFLKDHWYLVAYAVLHFLFYTTYLWLVQAWHIFSIIFIGTLFFIPPIFEYLEKNKKKLFIVLIFFLLLVKVLVMFSFPTMPWQVNYLEGANWINQNTLPEAIVGVYDAGIIAYFSERTTFNLDGIVNKEAYLALKEGEINNYITKRKINYLFGEKIDHPGFEKVKEITTNQKYSQPIWKKL